jgi:uncharacterized protein
MRLWSRPSAVMAGLVIGLAVGVASIDAAVPPLAEAIRRGQLDAARALLQKQVDVNEKLPDGTTALHWAVERDDADLVTGLINAKADPNVASAFGVTPLLLACRNGNAPIVNTLVRAGAKPDTPGRTGETPLTTAARTGRPEVVSALLEAGADLHAKEPHAGQTALMWGIAEGNARVVKQLLTAGASPTEPSKRGFTPLLFAARNGDIEVTKMLLERGVGVNDASQDGTTALVIATIRSQLDYARFLLDQGADPRLGPGFTPLHWVVGDWTSELAGEKTTVRPEGTEWDQLLPLLSTPQHEFVKLLLAKGADINARAKTQPRPMVGVGSGGGGFRGGNRLAGATPFLIASIHSDVPLMKFLLEQGADPKITTERNVNALMFAAGVDSGESIGYTGVTEEDALAAVKLCLELGLDVNAVSADGENALHGVAYRGNAGGNKLGALLIAKGIKVDVKNKRGWTPVTLAEGIYTQNSNSKNPELEKLLLAHGGKPSPPGIERDAYAVIKEEPQER